MAKFYCNHGSYPTYAAVPTWGVPQDGDGKAKTVSTSSATASIVFTGIPAGTISVCGVTVSPTFATDANTCANSLATAINAATGNVTTTGFRSAAVQLRNAVYARGPSGGAPAGTCQIMTRHGSADFNGQTAIAHTLTNVDSGSSQLTFSGGVSGCWGYFTFANNGGASTLWASAVTEGNYGVLSAAAPYACTLAAGDTVCIRSGKTLQYSSGGSGAGSLSSASLLMGTLTAPVILQFDDSTEWADGANPVFTLNMNRGYSKTFLSDANTTSALVFLAKKYSENDYGFVVKDTAGSTYSTGIQTNRPYLEFVGCYFWSPSGWMNFVVQGDLGISQRTHFRECKFLCTNNTPWLDVNALYRSYCFHFTECIFARTGTAVPYSGWRTAHTYAEQSAGFSVYMDSCKFVDFVAGSRLVVPNTSDNANVVFFAARNCDFGGMSVLGPNIATWGGIVRPNKAFMSSTQFGNRDFFIDNCFGFVEWNSNRSFPYCNAKLLDGVTGWSIHVIPTTQSGRNSRVQFCETPRIGKINSLADGVRTLTTELAIHSALALNKSHISAVIDYIDTDGNRQVIDTFDYAGGALTTSTATWSSESGGQVTFTDGATQYHDKYRFSVTTPTQIATGTEIGIVIRCHTFVDTVVKGFFVDPEIQVV